MAEKMIETWQLAVLRVRLDLSDRTPSVVTDMVGYPTGTARTIWTRRDSLSAFGIDATLPTSLAVPDDLQSQVVKTLVGDLNGHAALWLRLVPPYGYLGAVPWEESLVSATGLPLLRVPDRLPAAADLGRVWRVVIAVSAEPASKWVASYIGSLSTQLRETVRADVEVDVFADAWTAKPIIGHGLPPWVRVHEPKDTKAGGRTQPSLLTTKRTATYTEPPSCQLWSKWITSGLRGRAVRALHIVLDGEFDVDRPLLALPPDPQNPVPRSQCTFMTDDAVLTLADAIGADTLSFGSPPRNPADVATRMIADSVGQQRAGATMYSSLALDPDGAALAAAHSFIADRSGEAGIPRDPSLFAYLQPEHIHASLQEAWPEEPADSPERDVLPHRLELPDYQTESGLESYYEDSESVPLWVAAADRYLGNQWADLAKQAASTAPTAQIKGAYNKGVAEALTMLRDIVDRHARSS